MSLLHFTEGQALPPTPTLKAEQLLPNVIDGMAAYSPLGVYAQIPNSFTSYSAGYRKVTYRDLANAVNGVAWHLTERLGPGKTAETLIYFGPNDIGFVAVILGASKAGYSILAPSPWVSPTVHASLMDATACNKILTLNQTPYAPAVQSILDAAGDSPPLVVHVPTIFELLDQPHPHFPYPYTYAAIKDQPLVHVHSSGTTGAPKLLTYTHATVGSQVNAIAQPPPDGYTDTAAFMRSNRIFITYPFFHSGAIMIIFHTIANRTCLVTPLAGVPTTAAGIIEALAIVDVDALCTTALFFEQLAKRREWLEFVAQRVKGIGFGGADVSDAAGDAFIAAGVHVAPTLGSSEALFFCCIRAATGGPADAWHYIQPHPYLNVDFEHRGDGLYEMVLHRNPEPAHRQPVFTVFPHLTKFPTRDLFQPHPQDPRLWRFVGRLDNKISSATGELYDPTAFEMQLARLPEVEAALVVGADRWQSALLLEPAAPCPAPAQREALVARVWPAIERANALLTKGARITRTHVLVTAPDRPIQRAAKGSAMRLPTAKLYEKQLAELYRVHGDGKLPLGRVAVPMHLESVQSKGLPSNGLPSNGVQSNGVQPNGSQSNGHRMNGGSRGTEPRNNTG